MKITLYLVFSQPGNEKILKKVWHIPTDTDCPFWKVIIEGSFPPSPFGVLNYPHTNDTCTVVPFKGSVYAFFIQSRQTDTSTLSIIAEVQDVIETFSNTTVLGDHEPIQSLLLKNGWETATKEAYEAWRRISHLSPELSVR